MTSYYDCSTLARFPMFTTLFLHHECCRTFLLVHCTYNFSVKYVVFFILACFGLYWNSARNGKHCLTSCHVAHFCFFVRIMGRENASSAPHGSSQQRKYPALRTQSHTGFPVKMHPTFLAGNEIQHNVLNVLVILSFDNPTADAGA